LFVGAGGAASLAGGYVIVIAITLLLGFAGKLPGTRRRRAAECPECGYDCEAITADAVGAKTCPECGSRLTG
jgi:hypothetical protein